MYVTHWKFVTIFVCVCVFIYLYFFLDAPKPYLEFNEIPMLTSMDFYVKPEFTEGIYDSCKNVYLPSGDMKAIENMCGSLGSLCNAERWFEFMGKQSPPVGNGLAPFTINYKYLNESIVIDQIINNERILRNITPFTDTTSPCEQSVCS